MANEYAIKFAWPTTGLATLTAAIRKPDDALRDAQSAVALDDTGHLGLYSNTGAITITAGDSVIVSLSTTIVGAGEYLPAVTATTASLQDLQDTVDSIETKVDTIDTNLDTLIVDQNKVLNVVEDTTKQEGYQVTIG